MPELQGEDAHGTSLIEPSHRTPWLRNVQSPTELQESLGETSLSSM